MKHIFTAIKQAWTKQIDPGPSIIAQTLAPMIDGQHPFYLPRSGQAIHLRLATYQDLPTFIQLEERTYNGYHAWQLHDFQSDFRKNPYALYLLIEDEDGHVLAGMNGRFLARKSHISHVMVEPKMQGQGLGSYFMGLWVAAADYLEVDKIDLEVRVSNQAALALYQKYGFQIIERKPHYYFDNGEDAFLMRRGIKDGL